MKKIYTQALLFVLVISAAGCSKDVLKSYDRRIQGTWRLVDVDRVGIGGIRNSLPFREGEFTFQENGTLVYNGTGSTFSGSWNIRREWVRGNCITRENGDTDCDDRYAHTLLLTAVNFQTQEVRSEYFDELVFTGTNRFKAYVRDGFRTYVFRFQRR